MHPIDLRNRKFGRLAVLTRGPNVKSREVRWICRCQCGNKTIARSSRLRNGETRSCGCLMKEHLAAGTQLRHGAAKHGKELVEYKTWARMRNRCNNPRSHAYKRYGGRGIRICKRWDTFPAFFADMGPRPSAQHSIDRYPNNDGNYEPRNCRWATPKQQANNRGRRH